MMNLRWLICGRKAAHLARNKTDREVLLPAQSYWKLEHQIMASVGSDVGKWTPCVLLVQKQS